MRKRGTAQARDGESEGLRKRGTMGQWEGGESDAKARRKRCESDAKAMRKRCESDAKAMRKRKQGSSCASESKGVFT